MSEEWACCHWPEDAKRLQVEVARLRARVEWFEADVVPSWKAEEQDWHEMNANLRAVNTDLLAACELALEDGQRFKLSVTVKRRLRTAITSAQRELRSDHPPTRQETDHVV